MLNFIYDSTNYKKSLEIIEKITNNYIQLESVCKICELQVVREPKTKKTTVQLEIPLINSSINYTNGQKLTGNKPSKNEN